MRSADWVGRAPVVLSIELAVDTIAACLTSLLFREALRGPEVSIGSMQGTLSCSSW